MNLVAGVRRYDVLILFLLNLVTDICEDLNGLVSYDLFLVVEHLVQNGEQNTHCAVVALLSILLTNEHYQWNELIQESPLDILISFFGKYL